MKTKHALISLLFFVTVHISANAQHYYYHKITGTDTNEYRYNTLGVKLLEGNPVGIGNKLSTWQSLPFEDWYFFGEKVTGYYASDNGYITFDKTTLMSRSNNLALPDITAPQNAIFGFWDALELIQSSSEGDYLVHSWTVGAPPNRTHIIHWFNIQSEGHMASDDASLFFAIRLYESGDVNFDIVLDFELIKQGGTATPTSGTIGLQNSDGTKGVMVHGSPSLTFPESLGSGFADDIVYEFYYGDQFGFDMLITDFDLDSVVTVNTDVNISGVVTNYGSETVNSFDLNYKINNGSPVTSSVSSVNIPSGESYNFIHPIKWKATTDGEFVITIWASNINGNNDEYPSNDEMQDTIIVVGSFVQRMPLHEVFASSTCIPCVAGNSTLDSIFSNNTSNYTVIKYPMNLPIPGDPYYTTQVGERKNYYNIGTSVPSLCVDGTNKQDPNLYSEGLFDNYYDIPSVLDITASHEIIGKRIEFDISIHPYTNLTIDNLKAHIVVVENVTVNNVVPGFPNGESEFFYVMKRMIPSSSGTPTGPLTKDVDGTFQESYTFPADHTVEEFTDLSVIVFIQNMDTKEILQSAWSTETTSSIEDKTENEEIVIYPNPIQNNVNVGFNLTEMSKVSIDIYNTLMQKVQSVAEKFMYPGKHVIDIDLSNLPKGVYMIETTIDNKKNVNSLIK